MFDLHLTRLPDHLPDLQEAIEDSVRRRVALPDERAVTLSTMALEIDLSGARMEVEPSDKSKLEPPRLAGAAEQTMNLARLRVEADPVHLVDADGTTADATLHVDGTDVAFAIGPAKRPGTYAMVPTDGAVTVRSGISEPQMMKLLNSQARRASAEKGVTLSSFEVDVSTPDPQTVLLRGSVSGKKKVALFSAPFEIHFTADVRVEPSATGLQARIIDLQLDGEGTLMSMLLSMFQSRIDQFKAEPVPLDHLLEAAGVADMAVTEVAVNMDRNQQPARMTLEAHLAGRRTATEASGPTL